MEQLIIVYIIGAITLAYIAIKLYGVFFRGKSPCADCKGCELQSLLKESPKFNNMSSEQRKMCGENRELVDKKKRKRSEGAGSGSGCCG